MTDSTPAEQRDARAEAEREANVTAMVAWAAFVPNIPAVIGLREGGWPYFQAGFRAALLAQRPAPTLCDYATAFVVCTRMAGHDSDHVFGPNTTHGPLRRLTPEQRADLQQFAAQRIQAVWDDVGATTAEVLAQNVVAAQEFAIMQWSTLLAERPAPTHVADWTGWDSDHPEDGPSCSCGYNGTPEECAQSRAERPAPTPMPDTALPGDAAWYEFAAKEGLSADDLTSRRVFAAAWNARRLFEAERPAPTPDDREALIAALDDSDNWYYTGSRTAFSIQRAADALIAAGWHR